jgi:hypothetical protein
MFWRLSSGEAFSHISTFLSPCPKFSELLRLFRSRIYLMNRLNRCLSQVSDLWNFLPIDWTDFILYSCIFRLRFLSFFGYFSRSWIPTDSSFLLGLLLRCSGNEIYLQEIVELSTILRAFFWTFWTLLLLCTDTILGQCWIYQSRELSIFIYFFFSKQLFWRKKIRCNSLLIFFLSISHKMERIWELFGFIFAVLWPIF